MVNNCVTAPAPGTASIVVRDFVAKHSSTDENTPDEITDVLWALEEIGMVGQYPDEYWPIDFWYVK